MKLKYRDDFTITHGHSSIMTACVCGDVFQASGANDDVNAKHAEWAACHRDCSVKKHDGSKILWLSFCDNDKPKGSQFLGACLIEVTAEEADDALIDVVLRFPFAQPDAEWIAAAVSKAHRLGCNPGGEVATMEVPADHMMLPFYKTGVLMDKQAIAAIDALIECGESRPH